ncbi:glycosyltransferase [Acidisphaera sp. S103]|uniref:glycosyltransferase family 2 protein n=1 Tax=Acidisphaera sp. S103 TaxID=1747223 RepID=UPI00131EC7A1|nr:glycosyltransferase [Acidisphaera sp. S103]
MQFDFFPNSMRSAQHADTSGTRVAILTRTRNRPVTLARALVSVLSQSHTDWHLYLVNDGGDPAIVEQLVQNHESAFQGRVTLLHHPQSLGMEAASNAALAIAEGDFIVVHDDDDSWHLDFLTTTVSFLRRPENAAYAAVATNCTVIHERIESGVITEEQRSDNPFWQSQIDSARLLSRNSIPPITLLVRKSAVDAIGPFNAALPVLGDWDFNLRVLMIGDIATIDQPLAYYHWRRSSGQGAYGNSVMAGSDQHALYDVLYRNSLVRQLLAKEPSYLGLMQVLMRHTEDQVAQLSRQIDRNAQLAGERYLEVRTILRGIEQTLQQTQGNTQAVRQSWARLLPVRRMVARLRGRI